MNLTVLFSDEAFEVSKKLSNAVIETIKGIEASLTIEQKKILEKILTGGIDVIPRPAIGEYLRNHGRQSEGLD